MTPPFDLGAKTFRSRQAAKEHVARILWRWPYDQPITGEDAIDVGELFRLHPSAKRKVAGGADGVDYYVVRPTLFKARGFFAVRPNGSAEDFSYLKCFEPRRTPQQDLVDALRTEVHDDILQLKRAFFAEHGDCLGRIPCAVSGEQIGIADCHADHGEPSFDALVTQWIAINADRLAHSSRRVRAVHNDPYRLRLIDRTLAEDWRHFHHTRARMRLVKREVNLARAPVGEYEPQLDLAGLLLTTAKLETQETGICDSTI